MRGGGVKLLQLDVVGGGGGKLFSLMWWTSLPTGPGSGGKWISGLTFSLSAWWASASLAWARCTRRLCWAGPAALCCTWAWYWGCCCWWGWWAGWKTAFKFTRAHPDSQSITSFVPSTQQLSKLVYKAHKFSVGHRSEIVFHFLKMGVGSKFSAAIFRACCCSVAAQPFAAWFDVPG